MNGYTYSAPRRGGSIFLQRQKVGRKVEERTAHHSLLVPALLFLLIVSILGYVWTRVKVVQYGYEISAAMRAKEAAVCAHDE